MVHWNIMQKIVGSSLLVFFFLFLPPKGNSCTVKCYTLMCLFSTISTRVPFRPTTVQVSNTALIETKMKNSAHTQR